MLVHHSIRNTVKSDGEGNCGGGNMKRRKFVIATATSVVGGLAGCSSAGSSTGGSENTETETETDSGSVSEPEDSNPSSGSANDGMSESGSDNSTTSNSNTDTQTDSGSDANEAESPESNPETGSEETGDGEVNRVHEYEGSWSGEATGGVNVDGTIQLTVDYSNNEVSGSIEGDASGPIEGSVSDGEVDADASGRAMQYMTMNMDMTGDVSENLSVIEGDWSGESNTGMSASGSWTVSIVDPL